MAYGRAPRRGGGSETKHERNTGDSGVSFQRRKQKHNRSLRGRFHRKRNIIALLLLWFVSTLKYQEKQPRKSACFVFLQFSCFNSDPSTRRLINSSSKGITCFIINGVVFTSSPKFHLISLLTVYRLYLGLYCSSYPNKQGPPEFRPDFFPEITPQTGTGFFESGFRK